MKKLFGLALCAAVMLISGCQKEQLSEDQVYMFYQTTCPHCHDAAGYIKEKYPSLTMKSLDIKYPGNLRLFEQAIVKYKIKGAAGTPLLLLGDNYIMGWGQKDEQKFDEYVKPFLTQK